MGWSGCRLHFGNTRLDCLSRWTARRRSFARSKRKTHTPSHSGQGSTFRQVIENPVVARGLNMNFLEDLLTTDKNESYCTLDLNAGETVFGQEEKNVSLSYATTKIMSSNLSAVILAPESE